jgi:hypothetical protein
MHMGTMDRGFTLSVLANIPGTGWSPGIACALGLNGIIWVKSGLVILEDSSSGSRIAEDNGWNDFTVVLATSL